MKGDTPIQSTTILSILIVQTGEQNRRESREYSIINNSMNCACEHRNHNLHINLTAPRSLTAAHPGSDEAIVTQTVMHCNNIQYQAQELVHTVKSAC